ncbi:MAG TPA: hypothetical protein VG604_02575 [Candidatus Saccharimonadales bacterium]|nr:hypothetical protein [Candidatus Saccharimonadales bacterium]
MELNPCKPCQFGDQIQDLSAVINGYVVTMRAEEESTWNMAVEFGAALAGDAEAGGLTPAEVSEADQLSAYVLDKTPKTSSSVSEVVGIIEDSFAEAEAIDCATADCVFAVECAKMAFISARNEQIQQVIQAGIRHIED